jgi:hypothetical protein
MSGATPPFLIYDFKVRTGKALPLYPDFLNGSGKLQNMQWFPFARYLA